MEIGIPLMALQKTQSSVQTIRVQVIREWTTEFTHYGNERHVIIADRWGDIMYGTVRNHFLGLFQNTLTVGEWFEISAFEINTRGEEVKFSRIPYHIYFNLNTTVQPANDLNGLCKMYRPRPFNYINVGTILNNQNVVDLLGVIVEVHEMEVYPAIERPYDDIPEQRMIRIVLQDFHKRKMYCVVKNEFAERFLHQWLQTNSGWVYIMVLRFWDVKEVGVGYGVEASKDYSDFLIDPDIPIVEEAKITLHFSSDFQESYDFYRHVPGRPQPLF